MNSVQLTEQLRGFLQRKAIPYVAIHYNGSYEYARDKRKSMFTIVLEDRKRLASWNPDEGWKWDSHAHPGISTAQHVEELKLQRFFAVMREFKRRFAVPHPDDYNEPAIEDVDFESQDSLDEDPGE